MHGGYYDQMSFWLPERRIVDARSQRGVDQGSTCLNVGQQMTEDKVAISEISEAACFDDACADLPSLMIQNDEHGETASPIEKNNNL